MAANERSQSSCLALLKQQGQEFNFFQAVRLLEKIATPQQKVQFKAINSEAFQSNFIAGIEDKTPRNISTRSRITVSVNGFGLTGQQGPIPDCYSEMFRRAAVSGKKGAEDPHAFLDIFNDKHLSLLYEIKKHFDPMLFNELPTENFLYQLRSSISGLNTLNLFDRLPIAKDKLASFSPVMANRRVDYSLIYNVLKSYLNCDIKVTPNEGTWRALPKKYQAQCHSSKHQNKNSSNCTLNKDMGLGKGIGLGKKYWDNQAAISIAVNVTDIEKCQNLLPGGKEHQAFVALLTFLTDGKYFIYVKLLADWKDIPLSKLYKNTKLKLGQTSWIKSYQNISSRINHPQFVIKPSIEASFSDKESRAAA